MNRAMEVLGASIVLLVASLKKMKRTDPKAFSALVMVCTVGVSLLTGYTLGMRRQWVADQDIIESRARYIDAIAASERELRDDLSESRRLYQDAKNYLESSDKSAEIHQLTIKILREQLAEVNAELGQLRTKATESFSSKPVSTWPSE